MIKYPKLLNKVIGVSAISDGANLEKLDYAIENINNLGFAVIETPNVRKSRKLVSSSGKTRAKELLSLLKDENVELIISASGGEFAIDMLPYFHKYKKQIKSYSAKWIQGYSDTSLLLFYFTTNFNVATIHSQNFGSFAMRPFHKSLKDNIKLWNEDFVNKKFVQQSFEKYQDGFIEKKFPYEGYTLTKEVKYKSIFNENYNFSGRLIGGCIDTITQILGTEFDNTVNFCNQFKEGMIWYFDNFELNSCELYRRLIQMKNAGYFKNAKGFIFGRTMAKKGAYNFNFYDAIKKALKEFNVPIIYDADIGHVLPQLNIVNGAFASIKYKDNKMTLIQEFI